MKRTRLLLFIALFMLAITLYSCEQECKHANMTESKVFPTCTEHGETKYTCNDCEYFYISEITNPKGHIFDKEVIPGGCTSDGYTKYTCTCGESYISDYISATGHEYEDTVTYPDCETGGNTTHKCKNCDYTYISNHTDPKGHTLTEIVHSPTCINEGYTLYACEKCEYKLKSDYSSPTGHEYNEIVTSPTCTDEGYTTYQCKSCVYSYISDFIKPTGHSFDKIVTMPTLSDMGYTEYSCEKCDFEYTGDLRFYSDILPNAYANNSEVIAKGIDVSYHNYKKDTENNYIPLDWEAIKDAGVQYVIIRAGYSSQSDGSYHIDETFELSYLGAKAAGLDVGVYFYTCARNVNDIEIEANLLLNLLKGKTFEYPIYLDLEDESYLNEEKTQLLGIDAATLNEMCVKFFTVLQRSGYYTGLYVNHNWLNNFIDTEEALSRFEIWYARYPDAIEDQAPVWNTEENGAHLGMWQYTDSGYIGETKFDFNFAYKNYPEIIKQGGFNGFESNIKFPDSQKIYVMVIYDAGINIRSKYDYFVTDGYDASLDQITVVSKGSRFEVIEKTDTYAKIEYNGQIAYITSNPTYVTFFGANVE